ncbi:2-amino-4-hydroxy-6-hydroxymethyldihydropteridine diphosphokinase [Pragia fontium]|uniref:2-amino-4-hydroxy-6-hydroxymethyldihydropteridine pyrophosphokinase n=1 Tax=Pragia fontium TaxID=82985 RepID=A0ABQ5LK43_9GAMM|nr:2-amino-4-hydroxy-6-hydroxymethyldihydropteridine diphosphokinase [Pragia fontium]AKJ42942.1 2-amino-4-hydroxy-6-hydroxymethyldihydropteridine pyrophosphokinase [Pragia fontium]GKX63940.1 2-amino-4-hydroxy-6-hydroxymethyldihydropteridine diphosphokinase [Pragia fontium]SUB83358.1 2-amino-4-hydroxy-6-hydroxymethyldihydropteridinepyrophosphokinase [Pragia fontium]VEJ56254.1 2-amino-4-hydroxy-6-hydroxymethyldihydropteridinepyrophosphokinase [Pragia fontium]
MAQVFIALGSNLNQPLAQIDAALDAIKHIPQTQLVNCSRFYRTKPLGPQDQPDYLNAVVEITTQLQPEQLLDATQLIELNQGRVRKDERWGPRTLDLDILLFDNQTINTPRLTVPHYDMHNRAFMLYPLADIAPDLVLPNGISLAEMLQRIPADGLEPWFLE